MTMSTAPAVHVHCRIYITEIIVGETCETLYLECTKMHLGMSAGLPLS